VLSCPVGTIDAIDVPAQLPAIDVRWLGWLLESMGLGQYSASAAQPGIAVEVIENLRVWVPAARTQKAIADYLDTETARIDSVVQVRRQQHHLLDDREFAVLSQALVPAGVRMSRLRLMSSIQSGLTVDGQRDAGPDSVTRPYLRVANVHADELALDSVGMIT
jgi:type I restriction enzyme S subunit